MDYQKYLKNYWTLLKFSVRKNDGKFLKNCREWVTVSDNSLEKYLYLYSSDYLSFLVIAAIVGLEFIITAEGVGIRETF